MKSFEELQYGFTMDERNSHEHRICTFSTFSNSSLASSIIQIFIVQPSEIIVAAV